MDGIKYADDDKYSVRVLALMRIPPLVLGLMFGFILSLVTSEFKEVLEKDIETVFFIPFVVYMADAVGTQTQTIYVRDLIRGKAKFLHYLLKETGLGLILGSIFGLATLAIVTIWLKSITLAAAVGLATFAAVASAPLVALVVTEILELEHKDPAVGAGPIATVIQDTISVVVYGLIASALLLR